MFTLFDYYKKRHAFKENPSNAWKCRNCGFIRSGNEAPGTCPVCSHPQLYFEKTDEND